MHSHLFISVKAPQLYCPLDCSLWAVHSSLWPVQQFDHRDPLCIPQTETPFPSLNHTAQHSFLIRGGGGGRVEYTSCCCWPAPSKQEDLLGLITLASLFPPIPGNNKKITTVTSLYFIARTEWVFVFDFLFVCLCLL